LKANTSDKCLIGKALDSLGICHIRKESNFYDIRIADSILQFQMDWDSLLPAHHSLRSAISRVYESSSSDGVSYRYAIAYEGQKPVMCAAFQLISIRPENLQLPLKNEFVKYATKLMLNLHDIKLLVGGNVFREKLTAQYYAPDKVTEEEANQILAKFTDLISNKECVSAVIMKDLSSAMALPEGKFEKLEGDISMEMELDPNWISLGDYISSLSKKYAARAKKILGAVQDVETRELNEGDVMANKAILYSLYKQVIERQSFLFGELNEDYFVALKRLKGDDFVVKGLFLHGKLVAFCTYFHHPLELEVHYVGIDYTFNTTHQLYFYMHFLLLEEAILKKKQSLLMGRTSLEAKAILGCKPLYNNTFLAFKNPLAEGLFGYFRKDTSEPDNWKTRNPMKTSVQTAELS
jgi:hypothetical protein